MRGRRTPVFHPQHRHGVAVWKMGRPCGWMVGLRCRAVLEGWEVPTLTCCFSKLAFRVLKSPSPVSPLYFCFSFSRFLSSDLVAYAGSRGKGGWRAAMVICVSEAGRRMAAGCWEVGRRTRRDCQHDGNQHLRPQRSLLGLVLPRPLHHPCRPTRTAAWLSNMCKRPPSMLGGIRGDGIG